MFRPRSKTIRYSSEWAAKGVTPTLANMEKQVQEQLLPALQEQFEKHRIVRIPDTEALAPRGAAIRETLRALSARGAVCLPVRTEDSIMGMLCFLSERPQREWNVESSLFLEIIANTISDAVVRVDAEREINYIAYHDQLTRLPNRFLFRDRLQQAIRLAGRSDKMVGVVFMDLDAFKSVNDTMGHDLGDRLLYEVARLLSHCVRSYDTVSRFGGDEFVMIINQISDLEDIHTVMNKIIDAVHRPVTLAGQEFFVSVSAGVSVYPQDGLDPDTLIKNADTAMYRAKRAGKNRYELCSQEMKEEVAERAGLTNQLYRALERGQLQLYYQPQVSIETSTIVGLEALLRWQLADGTFISPSRFIPLAEQSGLVHSIGDLVLLTSCKQNLLWQDKGLPAMRIAVNISVQQLKNPNFVLQVARTVRTSGIEPQYLELEVTESVANIAAETMTDVFRGLKDIGVSISIDDFGSEYSSLSRLRILPVDRIKMDMQYVRGIECSETDQAITKVIISLAKSLNLKVIAEGVETEPQLRFLSQRMCDEVQGFYYFKPMPADEVERVLAAPMPLSMAR